MRRILATTSVVLTLAACSGRTNATETKTVTATVTQAATEAASTSDAAARTDGPSSADAMTPTDTTTDAVEGDLTELKDGQSATVGALQVTLKWGELDPTVETGSGPHDKGCTWVTWTAHNTASDDALFSDDSSSASNASPAMTTDVTAGDELRDVTGVMADGVEDWPRRIKAGKTHKWRQCYMATEKEQHIALLAFTGPGNENSRPVAKWVRQ